jgi:hypothetical protein
MIIDKEWLEEHYACKSGKKWFARYEFESDQEVVIQLLKNNFPKWSNWALVRLMNKNQRLQYAIYITKEFLKIIKIYKYEKDLAEEIIELAENVLNENTKKNRESAFDRTYKYSLEVYSRSQRKQIMSIFIHLGYAAVSINDLEDDNYYEVDNVFDRAVNSLFMQDNISLLKYRRMCSKFIKYGLKLLEE